MPAGEARFIDISSGSASIITDSACSLCTTSPASEPASAAQRVCRGAPVCGRASHQVAGALPSKKIRMFEIENVEIPVTICCSTSVGAQGAQCRAEPESARSLPASAASRSVCAHSTTTVLRLTISAVRSRRPPAQARPARRRRANRQDQRLAARWYATTAPSSTPAASCCLAGQHAAELSSGRAGRWWPCLPARFFTRQRRCQPDRRTARSAIEGHLLGCRGDQLLYARLPSLRNARAHSNSLAATIR